MRGAAHPEAVWSAALLLVLACGGAAVAARAQGQAPPAGAYPCLVSRLQHSPVVGPAGPLLIVVYDPSVLVSLSIDGRGNYRLGSRSGGTGRYGAAGGQFTFLTGPLGGWPALYERDGGEHTIRLAKTKEGQPNPRGAGVGEHRCTLKAGPRSPGGGTAGGGGGRGGGGGGAGGAPAVLNLGLRGTLTFYESWGSGMIVDFDVATGRKVSRFEGSDPHRAANGETVFTSRGQIVLARADGVTAATMGERREEASDPVLSPDGSRVAYESLPVYWDAKVLVRARDGRLVATFKGMTDPAWTPDGRLVMTASLKTEGARAGLFLSDPALQRLTRIDPGLDDAAMPAVSPDGRRVAFVYHGHVWAMNLDGSDLRQLTAGEEREKWPAWSPDGRSLVVAGRGEYQVVMLVTADSQKPVELKNAEGKTVQTSGRITWR